MGFRALAEIQKDAEVLGLRFIGPYEGVMKKTSYECPLHGAFLQTPNKVQQKLGCQKCGRQSQFSKRRNSEETVAARSGAAGLRYVRGYVNAYTPCIYACPAHGEISMAPSSAQRGSKCKYCAGRARFDALTDAEAALMGLVRLDPYRGNQVAVRYECSTHGVIRKSPDSIHAGKGCPGCAKYGFKPHLPAYFYAYHISNRCEEFIGFGVTNDLEERLKRHRIGLSSRAMTSEKLYEVAYPSGLEALRLEREVITKLKRFSIDTGIPGFVKEALSMDALDAFHSLVAGALPARS